MHQKKQTSGKITVHTLQLCDPTQSKQATWTGYTATEPLTYAEMDNFIHDALHPKKKRRQT